MKWFMKLKNDEKGLVIDLIAGAIALSVEYIPMEERFKKALTLLAFSLGVTAVGLELKDIYDEYHDKDE